VYFIGGLALLLRPVTGLFIILGTLNAQSVSTNLVETRHTTSRATKVWLVSALALLAATSVDASSSWGKYETNPLLASADGRFGARGVSIKFGLAAATIVPQILMRKNRGVTRVFTIANFGETVMFVPIVKHNYGISSPPPR
jgi:hypothetical protein